MRGKCTKQLKQLKTSNFMEIRPAGAELVHADRRTGRQTWLSQQRRFSQFCECAKNDRFDFVWRTHVTPRGITTGEVANYTDQSDTLTRKNSAMGTSAFYLWFKFYRQPSLSPPPLPQYVRRFRQSRYNQYIFFALCISAQKGNIRALR